MALRHQRLLESMYCNSNYAEIKNMVFFLSLSFNGVFKTPSFDGGGGDFPPPSFFIYEHNTKSNKIMHCVDLFYEW